MRVGRDRLIGVADMRRAVRIGDGGGDVEGVSVDRSRRGRDGSDLPRDLAGRLLDGLLDNAAACFGAETVFDFAFPAAFFADFLTVFFATGFPVFFAVFFARLSWRSSCAVFFGPSSLAFFTASWRAFSPPPPWWRGRGRPWKPSCVFRFLEVFLSRCRHHEFPFWLRPDRRDDNARNAYRVASASIPNTEKTSGFRSRL